jgi:hypothetical protein
MGISDLFLIVSFFTVLLGLFGLLVALLTRRWVWLRRIALGLAIYLGIYVLLLAGVSLLSPQKVMALHQPRCFDDWCASVEGVVQQPAIGAVHAQGTFYLVSIQVSSRAKRITQRARDAAIYLLDEQGNRYDPSLEGQQALDAAGLSGPPLDSLVDAGGSFTHTAVFDLPPGADQPALVHTHGAFPGLLVIGDDHSWLHKPTIVRLSPP